MMIAIGILLTAASICVVIILLFFYFAFRRLTDAIECMAYSGYGTEDDPEPVRHGVAKLSVVGKTEGTA